MTHSTVIYRAHTNIALIKYWGKRDEALFLPVTSSLSLTLDAFYTDTQVTLRPDLNQDCFHLNGVLQPTQEVAKISQFIDLFRKEAQYQTAVEVNSINHVPTAAGLASSASAYAALACGLNALFQINHTPEKLSTFARQGSGSATRSLFAGFAQWHRGFDEDPATSYAEQIDPADFDIGMLTAVVNQNNKKISSRQGMAHTVATSPFYKLWPQEVEHDLVLMRQAIRDQNIDQIGAVAEHNAMKMHASMLASNPSFTYFEADSLVLMRRIQELRQQGYHCYFTMDAGPNIKVIAPLSELPLIKTELSDLIDSDKLIISAPGPAPYSLTQLGAYK